MYNHNNGYKYNNNHNNNNNHHNRNNSHNNNNNCYNNKNLCVSTNTTEQPQNNLLLLYGRSELMNSLDPPVNKGVPTTTAGSDRSSDSVAWNWK